MSTNREKVIRALQKNPDATMKDLLRMTCMSYSNLTYHLNWLDKHCTMIGRVNISDVMRRIREQGKQLRAEGARQRNMRRGHVRKPKTSEAERIERVVRQAKKLEGHEMEAKCIKRADGITVIVCERKAWTPAIG